MTTRAPPPSRRPVSASPTSANPTRGPSARSASPRVPSSLNSASASRRLSSTKAVPSTVINGETTESLSVSLKQETDQKEQLLVQVQNKEQIIASLTAENNELTSALSGAETRLNELFTEQSRSELELAQRIDISEKLRSQVRDLEKEKRDIQRRYNEQTATFEAERQAFYDNEQHLKSRIQSLSQARKQVEPISVALEYDVEPEDEENEVDNHLLDPKTPTRHDLNDPEVEPAEMTSLKLELSTLSTSYSSLQSTLVLLQTQLVDLKRVNNELQEENESYMILLREKTLSGQFDPMRQVGGGSSDGEDDDDDSHTGGTDVGSLRSTTRSALDRVEEETSEDQLDHEIEQDYNFDTSSIDSTSHQSNKHRRKRTVSAGPTRGESLADLPITGPGLDLAAELGRAENKDILENQAFEDHSIHSSKGKRSKKSLDSRKVSSSAAAGLDPSPSLNDIDALRTEVKSLRDANKALSLYASKIIDRIISQEGFEHVLAVDYDKESSPVAPKSPVSKPPKARPQSVVVGRSTSTPVPEKPAYSPPAMGQPNIKTQRRSLSFDWKNFSIFNKETEKKPDSNLRPLTLKPGATPLTGGRKLDNEEDEEDRKERERINAAMKLMGIQPRTPMQTPTSFTFPASPALQRAPSTTSSTGTPPPTATNNRRFSWFGSKPAETSDSSSIKSTHSIEGSTHSGVGLGIPNLTRGALEQAEAESSLAALDAHERNLSAEIARGAGGGFTEISPRIGGRRSRRSAGGSSGSTIWSAGMMSGNGEDDE
ncbi:hypothetical protein H0H92_001487 [Tricholoma furcatifolium]|nr:hypothetical protein H0H92_001487 [Tricholoma furcatifolium]